MTDEIGEIEKKIAEELETGEKTRSVFSRVVPYKESEKTPAEIPKAKFRQAIWQSFGNTSALARLLGVNYTTLRGHLRRHKDLAALMEEAREKMVDDAEDYVMRCLRDETLDHRSRADLAKFVLKTQGKARGWGEGPQIAQQINVAGEGVDLQQIFGI